MNKTILTLTACLAMTLCATAQKFYDGSEDCPMTEITVKKTNGSRSVEKIYNVADVNDSAMVYKSKVDKNNCFIVISKKELRLYVYEKSGKDTLLVAHYPVCCGKNTGQKTKTGDAKTPSCNMQKSFCIKQIIDASGWYHDFKDDLGNHLSFGAWFMRLDLRNGFDAKNPVRNNTSIGIHGSTGNEESVPGRDSEGCIRLRDKDIKALKSNFCATGTKVVIKDEAVGKYDFEKEAIRKLGEKYRMPVIGNPLAK